MKSSRSKSFIVVALVYAIAIVCGVLTYNLLKCDVWLRLLIADVAATVVTFIFSVVINNASVYDPYWSVQPIVITLAFAFSVRLNGAKVLMIIAILYWGIRLTANWAYTFKGLNHQDWRYTMLKEKTGKLYPLVNFFGIHLFPTIVVYLCILPVVYLMQKGMPINAFGAICFALCITAATLQLVADVDMQKFRNKGNGGFIRTGLWKYSRHPNYLGEILMWWGVALFVISAAPHAWYLAIGAFVNTLMFLFVSIPMADNRQSKKAGFNNYKKQTRMLLPIKK